MAVVTQPNGTYALDIQKQKVDYIMIVHKITGFGTAELVSSAEIEAVIGCLSSSTTALRTSLGRRR